MNYCEIWHIYNMKWNVPKLKNDLEYAFVNDLEYAFVQNLLSNLAPHHPIVRIMYSMHHNACFDALLIKHQQISL